MGHRLGVGRPVGRTDEPSGPVSRRSTANYAGRSQRLDRTAETVADRADDKQSRSDGGSSAKLRHKDIQRQRLIPQQQVSLSTVCRIQHPLTNATPLPRFHATDAKKRKKESSCLC